MNQPPSHRGVLAMIAGGLILILLAIVAGMFLSSGPLPDWAENVLITIGTAAILKLGDSISAVVALATGRQLERTTDQLAASAPVAPPAVGEG